MNKITIILLIAIIFSLKPIYGQIQLKYDSLLREHMKLGFNGNFMYSKDDSIYFSGNYGIIDIYSKKELNDSTLFDLASCTKQFTALAIIQLIEKGEIDYSTTVDSILSNFPYKGITIENLLRHQSGLPDYEVLLWERKNWKRKNIATNKDAIDLLKRKKPKLKFDPGTEYEYSNTGYMLLASIIEEISKKSYSEYLKEHIFLPAGMNNSTVYRRRYKPEKIKNTSKGFVYNQKKKKSIDVDHVRKWEFIYWLDGFVGDGMINSTLIDLEKWKQSIRYNRLISEESKKRMFAPDEISKTYGYGFMIDEKEKSVYHTGSWPGYYSLTYYVPSTNEYLVILNNNGYKGFLELKKDILKLRKEYSAQQML